MRNFDREFLLKIFVPNKELTGYPQSYEIQNLRVAFTVTKRMAWAGNPAVIRVYNLNKNTRNAIKNFGCKVELHAGYRLNGGLQLIYTGFTNTVSHDFNYPEIVTTLECTDSALWAADGPNSQGSISFAAGTLGATIITECARLMGIPVAPFPPFQNLAYPHGFSQSYTYKEAIIKVCDFLNLQPTFQNNTLYIYPLKFSNSQKAVAHINQTTGMIGIPQRFTNMKSAQWISTFAPRVGYRVNMVLTPFILPGFTVNLSSSHLEIENQPHIVQTIRHAGDTYGPEWISNIEMTVIQ